MKTFRSFLALFLVAVLSLAVAPKELLHAFHDHEDSHHGCAPEGVVSFEEAHVHCALFSVESPVYLAEEAPAAQTVTVLDFIFCDHLSAQTSARDFFHPDLRGPPAC